MKSITGLEHTVRVDTVLLARPVVICEVFVRRSSLREHAITPERDLEGGALCGMVSIQAEATRKGIEKRSDRQQLSRHSERTVPPTPPILG